MFLETGDWVAEQISGQMISDTKAPGFGGFLMFQNPNARVKGPLILGRLEGVRRLQRSESRAQAESHITALFPGAASAVLGWLLPAGDQS